MSSRSISTLCWFCLVMMCLLAFALTHSNQAHLADRLVANSLRASLELIYHDLASPAAEYAVDEPDSDLSSASLSPDFLQTLPIVPDELYVLDPRAGTATALLDKQGLGQETDNGRYLSLIHQQSEKTDLVKVSAQAGGQRYYFQKALDDGQILLASVLYADALGQLNALSYELPVLLLLMILLAIALMFVMATMFERRKRRFERAIAQQAEEVYALEGEPRDFELVEQKLSDQAEELGLLIEYYKREQQAILETIVDALIIIDEKGQISRVNPSCLKLLGYSKQELLGSNVSMLMGADVAAHHDQYIRNFLETGTAKIIGIGREVKARRKDGTLIPVHLAISKYEDKGRLKFVGVLRDISKEVVLRERLVKEATHDVLTGLPSRRKLKEYMEASISRAQRVGTMFAVLFIDLDNFKPINDEYGHAAGDDVLIQVARRLLQCTRKEDHCARIGGDEFVVVINDLSAPEVLAEIRERYRHTLSLPVEIEGHLIPVEASIGSSLFPRDATSYDELIRQADQSMFDEKVRKRELDDQKGRRGEAQEKLFSLTYISDSLISNDEVKDALMHIRIKAEKNNAAARISGMLLFKHHFFVQRLEGSREALQKTLARIELDPRHRNISVLYFGPIKARYFNDWSQMPSVELSDSNPELDELIAQLRAAPREHANDNEMMRFFEQLSSNALS